MTTIDHLADLKVVPVIRAPTRELGQRAIEWLYEVGFQTFEVTLTTPGAIDLVADLSKSMPDALLGAGTVLRADEAARAIDAGARYIVTPCRVDDVVNICHAEDVPLIAGASTPSEILANSNDGAAAVKIFPARQLGGPSFIRAVKTVFPDIPLMPTGGISPADISDYLDAGAFCVGLGSELAPLPALQAQDKPAVTLAAERCLHEAAIRPELS